MDVDPCQIEMPPPRRGRPIQWIGPGIQLLGFTAVRQGRPAVAGVRGSVDGSVSWALPGSRRQPPCGVVWDLQPYTVVQDLEPTANMWTQSVFCVWPMRARCHSTPTDPVISERRSAGPEKSASMSGSGRQPSTRTTRTTVATDDRHEVTRSLHQPEISACGQRRQLSTIRKGAFRT